MTRPRILVVGGHDPSGAGIDADRDAADACGVEARTVVTARTDQTDRDVRSVGARATSEWTAEALEEVEHGIAAIKFGLLPGIEHVRAARRVIDAAERADRDVTLVLDPVIESSSGFAFLDERALDAVRDELLGDGPIVTPNLPEAARLAGVDPATLAASPEARVEAALLLLECGARAVLLKGGHGDEDPVRDLLLDARHMTRPTWIERPRLAGTIRGSGCRYATAVAAACARGRDLPTAAREAGELVAARIRDAHHGP